jgi:hypothetical protein
MRAVLRLLFALSLIFSVVTVAQDNDNAMTVGIHQEICASPSAENKAACRFYLLGVTLGVTSGFNIADGKTKGGRPCITEDISGSALELA